MKPRVPSRWELLGAWTVPAGFAGGAAIVISGFLGFVQSSTPLFVAFGALMLSMLVCVLGGRFASVRMLRRSKGLLCAGCDYTMTEGEGEVKCPECAMTYTIPELRSAWVEKYPELRHEEWAPDVR